ncbi:MAG: Na/Pi cotransporter family protein [Phycisphaerae bacterium]|nr:Na/Pi cotransporter family protein [Phycisphaerae bacterium]
MDTIHLGALVMGVFGGLAIFLFGMEQMTDAMKSVAGAGMSKVLEKLTSNRVTGAITGAIVTAVIQSSSVTTVLVVGFISAGLMSLQQCVGVIMGANIGTTVTAQVVAFKVTQYALALVAIGFGGMFLSKRKTLRLYGAMIMGLGMIFLGMGVMSDATEPLRSYEPFVGLMQQMDNPLMGILVAAAFTALVQSSSATTGIVIMLAAQGFITLEAGIALAFGSNIGTCVTAVLAAIGKPREAAQAAAVHLLFNVLGVLIWLPLIGFLAQFVQSFSPAYPELEGVARLAAETPRQIANAHTAFNVANTCLFIWFTGPMANLVTRLLPRIPEVIPETARPRYIQDVYLETPAIALDGIRRETIRLGEQVRGLGTEAGTAVVLGSAGDLDDVVTHARENQRLYDVINEYIRRLSATELTATQSRRLAALTAIAGHVQNIAETNAINLVAIGRERVAHHVSFGAETLKQLGILWRKVGDAFDLALEAMEEPEMARRVIDMKPEIQELAANVVEHLAQRLAADEPDRALLYRLETQVVEIIQREYYFAKKIAKEVIRGVEASIEDPVLGEDMAAAAPAADES